MASAADPTTSSDHPPSSWRWPRLTVGGGAAMAGVFVLVALANGAAVWLGMVSDGDLISIWRPLVWEGTSAFAFWLALPIVLTACANAPVPTRRWTRLLAIHLAGYLLTTTAHMVVMLAARKVLYPLAGWGPYDVGALALRIPMEALRDFVSYLLLASIFTLLSSWRERQRHRLHAAQLEAELRASQLHHLSSNLHPHFLFNALNTISAVMYEDLGKTDRLIADLGELLRQSLRTSGPAWPLREERAYVEKYVAVLQARFGDRLRVEWRIPAELEGAPLPRFALQTLVENAVKHNEATGQAVGVVIEAEADASERWHVEVRDDGRGFGAAPDGGEGIGLEHLRRRLALLHGEAARVDANDGPEGGARVRLTLPRETA